MKHFIIIENWNRTENALEEYRHNRGKSILKVTKGVWSTALVVTDHKQHSVFEPGNLQFRSRVKKTQWLKSQ